MFSENEFDLLCRTWQRSYVPVTLISPDDIVIEIQPQTVYKFRDNMNLSFLVFTLPRPNEPTSF